MLRFGAALLRSTSEGSNNIASGNQHGRPSLDSLSPIPADAITSPIEQLKLASSPAEKLGLLAEIHKAMSEDSSTKDAFRELDGFLVLINVLSTLDRPPSAQSSTSPSPRFFLKDDHQFIQVETLRFVFEILSEALTTHHMNQTYFQGMMGHQILEQTLGCLLTSIPSLSPQAFGYVAALAFQDFSIANVFVGLFDPSTPAITIPIIDSQISSIKHRLILLRNPQALLMLLNLRDNIGTFTLLFYAALKLIEKAAIASHRNQAQLNQTGLVGVLFPLWYRNTKPLEMEESKLSERLLKRALEMGASFSESTSLLRATLTQDLKGDSSPTDWNLDDRTLDLVKVATKLSGRWPGFISLASHSNGGSVTAKVELPGTFPGNKAFPSVSGLTFLCWVYIDSLPPDRATGITLLDIRSPPSRAPLLSLRLLPSLKFELALSTSSEPVILNRLQSASSGVLLRRWTHVALVLHSSRSISTPSARLFLDGGLFASHHAAYPKSVTRPVIFSIGNTLSDMPSGSSNGVVWHFSSAHLIDQTLPSDVPRLIYTLGPRYSSNFQDPLGRYLTYKSGTSLNIALFQHEPSTPITFGANASLLRAIRDGLGIREDAFRFALFPHGVVESNNGRRILNGSHEISCRSLNPCVEVVAEYADLIGDVIAAPLHSFDQAIWELGGPSILLRLVDLARTEPDLNTTLTIFSDAIRSSWRLSEDLERISGYEILSSLLHSKVHLIGADTYYVLFGFLGMDFANPENSTITNPIAYRVIALDFSLWSHSSLPASVQRLYLAHFRFILQRSNYRHFNAKARFAKFGVVKKLLYVIQAPSFYADDMIPDVIHNALSVAAASNFSGDAAIMPIIWYLAANLEAEETTAQQTSPGVLPTSFIPTLSIISGRERAEQVLEVLVDILASDAHLAKFKSTAPAPQICMLLLGNRPTSATVAQVLALIALILVKDPGFSRKLETTSFWTTLRHVLPPAWDPRVHVAAFEVLFGRPSNSEAPPASRTRHLCSPHILPAILAALEWGLCGLAKLGMDEQPVLLTAPISSSGSHNDSATTSMMEVLIEELIDAHSSSPAFRGLFQNVKITDIFLRSFQLFASVISVHHSLYTKMKALREKLVSMALVLALDDAIDVNQREQLMVIANIDSSPLTEALQHLATKQPQLTSLSHTSSHHSSSSLQLNTDASPAPSRISIWKQNIIIAERLRFKKAHQDHREHLRRLHKDGEWRNHLHTQYGLWPSRDADRQWRLDETEGPLRIKKKLVLDIDRLGPQNSYSDQPKRETSEDEIVPASVTINEEPPWVENIDLGVVYTETREDKFRRIRRELEPGDVINAIQTVTRVLGVDASPGMLIVGRSYLYMLDGLLENEEGEIVEACDVPKDVLSAPGTLLEFNVSQRAQRWALESVSSFCKRSFLFRDVGLEIYFKDNRSFLIVFPQHEARQKIIHTLKLERSRNLGESVLTATVSRTPLLNRFSSRFTSIQADEVSSAQRRWQAREISNFAYLCIINQASGRTPNDLTQYPVFPWVLADYDSETLDLSDPASFRDLTKPMGALTEGKRGAAEARYSSLQQIEEVPFHYGTHFSSSMIVSHFLIRLSPFSHYFKILQGGNWDLPDRLFSDVKRTWLSASEDGRGDVRELIPEFFTCPEFLENISHLEFGTLTSTGEKIDAVGLPPWAKKDAYLFIWLHRLALESEFVSEHLPAWIDLIWGNKQRDPTSLNVFHPLSYEGAIDLDSIKDDREKEAMAGIIHNFGQTPRKLFSGPHPSRFLGGVATLPLGTPYGIPEHHHLLFQSPQPLKDIGAAVASLTVETDSGKVLPSPRQFKYIPGYHYGHVQWGFSDYSIRYYIDGKVAKVVGDALVTCCSFADSETLVTGTSGGTVDIWRLARNDSPPALRQASILRGHLRPPTCIAVSKPWSLIASGADDGLVIFWDLNNAQFVRAVKQENPVELCEIHQSTGDVAVYCHQSLKLYTINGRLIASLSLKHEQLSCLAFHEREWTPVPILATGSPNGRITLRTWKEDSSVVAEKAQWKFATLRVLEMREEIGATQPTLTCLQFSGETLYSGDERGRVHSWRLPDQ